MQGRSLPRPAMRLICNTTAATMAESRVPITERMTTGTIPLHRATPARMRPGIPITARGGGTIGVVQAYVADVSPPDRRTKSLGWLSAITSLGAVAGPAVGSLLVSLGGLEFVGLGAAGIALLVAVFAWRFLTESRRVPTPGGVARRTSQSADRKSTRLKSSHRC
mgnify:CR=1 FL=1